jgi:hypothetical protein
MLLDAAWADTRAGRRASDVNMVIVNAVHSFQHIICLHEGLGLSTVR